MREFVYSNEELSELLQRGESAGAGDTKSYFLYFYENKNIARYLERMKRNGINPIQIERNTILNPDEYDGKWEKIRAEN